MPRVCDFLCFFGCFEKYLFHILCDSVHFGAGIGFAVEFPVVLCLNPVKFDFSISFFLSILMICAASVQFGSVCVCVLVSSERKRNELGCLYACVVQR